MSVSYAGTQSIWSTYKACHENRHFMRSMRLRILVADNPVSVATYVGKTGTARPSIARKGICCPHHVLWEERSDIIQLSSLHWKRLPTQQTTDQSGNGKEEVAQERHV